MPTHADTGQKYVPVASASSLDPRLTLNSQLLIENKQPIHVMLGLQMTLEGSHC
jgi:hypothetical protein